MHAWAGRIIFSLIGAALFQHAFGIIVGALAGYLFDRRQLKTSSKLRAQRSRIQEFSELSIILSVKFSQLNGPISHSQIATFKKLTHYQSCERNLVGQLFNRARTIQVDANSLIHRLGVLGQIYPNQLLSLHRVLQGIFETSGGNELQQHWLERCARAWNLPSAGQRAFKGSKAKQSSTSTIMTDLAKACDVLGVSEDVTLEDLKDTYKNLVKTYHPDKLRAKNANAKRLAVAEEKLRQVNAAYELIKKHIQSS